MKMREEAWDAGFFEGHEKNRLLCRDRCNLCAGCIGQSLGLLRPGLGAQGCSWQVGEGLGRGPIKALCGLLGAYLRLSCAWDKHLPW
jgi:hypothetical protein